MNDYSDMTFSDIDLYLCSNWAIRWPFWVGGNNDFIKQGQPFYKVLELIKSTSLEV